MEVRPPQFRLRTFFIAVALVAFFLAGRILTRGELYLAIPKTYMVSLATAVFFSIWQTVGLKEPSGKSVLGRSLASGLIAALCGMAIGIEIALHLAKIAYFDWRVDWIILLRHAAFLFLFGSVIGFFVIAVIVTIRKAIAAQ